MLKMDVRTLWMQTRRCFFFVNARSLCPCHQNMHSIGLFFADSEPWFWVGEMIQAQIMPSCKNRQGETPNRGLLNTICHQRPCHVIPFFVRHMTLCVCNNYINCFQWFVYMFFVCKHDEHLQSCEVTILLQLCLLALSGPQHKDDLRTIFNIILTRGIDFFALQTDGTSIHKSCICHAYNCMCKTSVAQTLGTFISENWQLFQRACALIELRCSIYEVPLWEMVIETNKDHEKNRVFLFQKWHTANNSINETSTSHWHCDEIRSILLVFMSRGMQPVPFNHMWKHMQKATIPFGGPAHSQFHFSLFAIPVMHDAQTIGLHGYEI